MEEVICKISQERWQELPCMESLAHHSRQMPKHRQDNGRFMEITGVLTGWGRVFLGSHLPENNFQSFPVNIPQPSDPKPQCPRAALPRGREGTSAPSSSLAGPRSRQAPHDPYNLKAVQTLDS